MSLVLVNMTNLDFGPCNFLFLDMPLQKFMSFKIVPEPIIEMI